jgi:hypothetical protein
MDPINHSYIIWHFSATYQEELQPSNKWCISGCPFLRQQLLSWFFLKPSNALQKNSYILGSSAAIKEH